MFFGRERIRAGGGGMIEGKRGVKREEDLRDR